MARQANLRLIFICSGQGPDWKTSRADARAAVSLALGVHPDDIDSLGYARTEESYISVRRSWIHHIEQFGFNEFFEGRDLARARGWWENARPDLVADDWLKAARTAHLARYPDVCPSATRGSCTLHGEVTDVLEGT
jgi:hypothetical protein